MIADHLHNEGFKANRKTVYRLMRKLNLLGYRMKRRRRYSSFEGEIEGRIKPKLFSFYEKRGFKNEGKTSDDIPDPDGISSYNMVKDI
ncbi:hypothetical protein AYJ53_03545 [Lactobacillus johnsonii]|uniref:HTH-like domain-containing protein n=1 Tax=Lactobacillus johnsonii TaxID=33959 RepID=A0A9X0J6L2_LACJH|nr:hypothetical protein AYJ53_03545 [Lactobacillus johnsonii]